jgi:hypothetical protein
MARLINQLTEAKIRTLTVVGMYHDGAGLYLQVRPHGAVSWIFRFRLNGRTRDMGIGSLTDIGLIRAREKAAAARTLLAQGIDPIEHSRSQSIVPAAPKPRHGPTFEQCAERYMADKLTYLRSDQHRYAWRFSLQTYAYPIIGGKSVNEIDTNDVLAVLRPIWSTKCQTASRLRGRIERVLAFAAVQGLRSANNPALWKGHLKEALPSRS